MGLEPAAPVERERSTASAKRRLPTPRRCSKRAPPLLQHRETNALNRTMYSTAPPRLAHVRLGLNEPRPVRHLETERLAERLRA